jgi:SAM-dependent MidA family methyltransferase
MKEPETSALTAELAGEIRRDGPVTFARFMEQALYHPEWGFYSRGGGPWGEGRDFVTSVDAGPVFAGLMMPLFRACWEAAGAPEVYPLIDAGGGDGRFAELVSEEARAAGDDFGAALQPVLADRCGAGRGAVFPGTDSGPCCIFANELIDALPVHLVRMQDGRLEEGLVDEAEGRFVWLWAEPTTPLLAGYFADLGVELLDGQRATVNLEAGKWLESAAGSLDQGHLVIIDYGYPAPALYSPEVAAEPLRTYRGGVEGAGPLADPGLQDITAMVDFTSLGRRAMACGFTVHCFTDQYRLLQRLAERLAEDPAVWERIAGGAGRGLDALKRGMALRSLLSPEGISGSFRVLVLSRGEVGRLPLLAGLKAPSGAGFQPVE